MKRSRARIPTAKKPLWQWSSLAGLAVSLAFGTNAFAAEDVATSGENYAHLSGYARVMTSNNLKDSPETPRNDKGQLSMFRETLELVGDAKTGSVQWKAIARADHEEKTPYLKTLQNMQAANYSPGGPGSNITSLYNQTDLREFYADFDATDRLHLRLGKQQVAWGETDFFHIMDVIQGYDYRWHSFLEADNDELRKPLIMANATLQFPELNGALQVLVRPGLDRGQDIGITYDLSGGRWALQPNRGVDFLAPGWNNYNYHHPDANINDTTGGVRWTGNIGAANYSLSYVKSFNPNPIMNSNFAPYMQKPTGAIGDFIFPEINILGASLSGTVDALDAVVAAEVGFERNAPYNIGTNFSAYGFYLPGFDGIMKKNVTLTTLRFDKQFKWMSTLGTSQASFFSAQLFDTWIRDFRKSDDLVDLAGFGAPAKEHNTIFSGFLVLNYMNNKVNPGLVFGRNLSTQDSFLVPNVTFPMGDHWRFGVEADLFFAHHQKMPGQVETSSYFMGNLANHDQLMMRLTYQF